jgi:hypothetical protein
LPAFLDDSNEILAIIGGLGITTALVVALFILPDVREIVVGALIAQSALIFNHFFGKRDNGSD